MGNARFLISGVGLRDKYHEIYSTTSLRLHWSTSDYHVTKIVRHERDLNRKIELSVCQIGTFRLINQLA